MVNEPVVLLPPPGEVHDVLLVDDQATTEVAPIAIEDGVAVSVTAGAGTEDAATVTVVLWVAVPPGPVHVTVYVVLVYMGSEVKEPVVPVLPPDVMHEVLPVDDQLR